MRPAKLIDWPLALSSIALTATHLTSILLIAAEALFVVLFLRGSKRTSIVISLAVAGLGSSWLLSTASSVWEKRLDWQSVSSTSELLGDIFPGVAIYCFLPMAIVAGLRVFRRPGGNGDLIAEVPLCRRRAIILALFWGFGPLGSVLVLSAAGWLPIGSSRYAVVGSAAFPILAGLWISLVCRDSIKTLLVISILVLAVVQNPLFSPSVLSDGGARFRNENWKSAVEELDRIGNGRPQLVFLFSNLVEDHRVADVEGNTEFEGYLKFPLSGIYKLAEGSEIVPMPTLTAKHWTMDELDRIVEHRKAQIIARVSADRFRQIMDELNDLAIHANLNLHLRHEVKSQPKNLLLIVELQIVEP